MSTLRLSVMFVLFMLGAAMAGLGATNPRLTELLYVFWIPEVLGVLVLITAPKRTRRTEFSQGAWKGNQEALHALGLSHGFTPEELEANRGGRLHAEQIAVGVAKGNTDITFGKTLLAIGAVLFVAGMLVPFFPRALKDFDFTFQVPVKPAGYFVGVFLGGLLGALPLMFGAMALRFGRRVVQIFEAGKVLAVAGPLKPLKITKRRGGTVHYYVVNQLSLRAPREGFDAMKGGGPYRVYYVPERLEVVSLEPA